MLIWGRPNFDVALCPPDVMSLLLEYRVVHDRRPDRYHYFLINSLPRAVNQPNFAQLTTVNDISVRLLEKISYLTDFELIITKKQCLSL